MSTLLQKANQIKLEKDTKIIPGNLKAGVTAFGVEGNLTELNPINGIIEQYKATTSTIDVNTFVEFVNNTTFVDTTLVDAFNSSGEYVSACLIDTNKVFIAHCSDDTNDYLNGIVCTISGTTITPGTDTTLVNVNNSYEYVSACLIDTNKVFIAHNDGENDYLNGIVCTIDGTTITPGTDTNLVNTSYSSVSASAVLIDTNKVFIAHCSGSSTDYHLNGIVCTISGTTITAGADTTLVNVSGSYEYANACLIDTNKVFIAHCSGSSSTDYHLNGIVCEINGTTITPGTDTTLVNTEYACQCTNVIKIDTNKIFIAHANMENINLNGVACQISGTNILASRTVKEADTKIEGITKTECTTSVAGDVYVLAPVVEEVDENTLGGEN